MKKLLAICIDWENIRKTVFERPKREDQPEISLNYNNPETVRHFISSFVDPYEEEIFRIFLYLSEPESRFRYHGKLYDFSDREVFRKHKDFIRKMSVQDYFAIRKGKLKLRGFKDDKYEKPILVQKGVDMLMGLDIAHLSYKKIVDRILILSGDTDIKPAIKTARINGVQVIISNCPDIIPLAEELKAHADIIRSKNFYDICYEFFKNNLIQSISQWNQNGRTVRTGLVIKSWINNWGLVKTDITVVNDFFKKMIDEKVIEINQINPENPLDGEIILK